MKLLFSIDPLRVQQQDEQHNKIIAKKERKAIESFELFEFGLVCLFVFL